VIRRAAISVAISATVVAVLAGCGAPPIDPSPTAIAIRTVAFSGACRGVGASAVVHGAPDDADVVWLTPLGGGPRLRVVWPNGDVAVFDPTLRIVDTTGRTVIREGEYVDGGCVTGPDANGPLLVPNPPDSFRLDCGPIRPADCPSMVNAIRYGSPNWPAEPVRSVTFTGPAGQYTIVVEDGRQIDGIAPPI
jgi:hypothetical protein